MNIFATLTQVYSEVWSFPLISWLCLLSFISITILFPSSLSHVPVFFVLFLCFPTQASTSLFYYLQFYLAKKYSFLLSLCVPFVFTPLHFLFLFKPCGFLSLSLPTSFFYLLLLFSFCFFFFSPGCRTTDTPNLILISGLL